MVTRAQPEGLLGGAEWGNSRLLPLGLYDSQGEELQAIIEHGYKGLSFLQQVLSEPDGAFKGLIPKGCLLQSLARRGTALPQGLRPLDSSQGGSCSPFAASKWLLSSHRAYLTHLPPFSWDDPTEFQSRAMLHPPPPPPPICSPPAWASHAAIPVPDQHQVRLEQCCPCACESIVHLHGLGEDTSRGRDPEDTPQRAENTELNLELPGALLETRWYILHVISRAFGFLLYEG